MKNSIKTSGNNNDGDKSNNDISGKKSAASRLATPLKITLSIPLILIFAVYGYMLYIRKTTLIISGNDGGICSQIFFYGRVRQLENRGYRVKWDTTWFRNMENLLTGSLARNFELNKAFPPVKNEIATEEEVRKCKEYTLTNFHPSGLKNMLKIRKPCTYITGYDGRGVRKKDWKYLRDNFKPELDDANRKWFKMISEDKNSCGVHVRRGDLSTREQAMKAGYPEAATVEYYVNAINFLLEKNKNMTFYFFSEEKDWIRDNIIPKLDKNINYHLVDANDSSGGYLDLYLLSNCSYLIGSHGSFGYFAYMLSSSVRLYIPYENNRNKHKGESMGTWGKCDGYEKKEEKNGKKKNIL